MTFTERKLLLDVIRRRLEDLTTASKLSGKIAESQVKLKKTQEFLELHALREKKRRLLLKSEQSDRELLDCLIENENIEANK